MAPYMLDTEDGRQKVNIIRLVEQALGAAVSGAFILYGGYLVLGERVDAMTDKVEIIAEAVTTHIRMDMQTQKEVQSWRLEQHAILTRHETVLRQEEILK